MGVSLGAGRKIVRFTIWPSRRGLAPQAVDMWYDSGMSTRELIERELDVLSEALQREVYDFARFLRLKSDSEAFNGLLASESVLARDWDTPEEDAAWANL
jgi:hypothetical protein